MPFVHIVGGQSREAVLQDTWGHLAPVPRRPYPGFVLFGFSAFGQHLILDYDFEGLPENPWTHDEVAAFVDQHLDTQEHPDRYESGEMRIYRWEGTYRRLKNGTPQFSGKVRPQRITDFRSRTPARFRHPTPNVEAAA
ncbi:hypothetical protein [Methylobacterium fujisawaense]